MPQIKFSKPYIFATRRCKPILFWTKTIWCNIIHSLAVKKFYDILLQRYAIRRLESFSMKKVGKWTLTSNVYSNRQVGCPNQLRKLSLIITLDVNSVYLIKIEWKKTWWTFKILKQYYVPLSLNFTNHPKTIQKLSKNYSKTIQKLSKTIQKLSKNHPKPSKNYPKTIQKPSKNYPKTIQKLSKPIQKPSKNNPKNVQNYPKTIQKQTNWRHITISSL